MMNTGIIIIRKRKKKEEDEEEEEKKKKGCPQSVSGQEDEREG